MFASVIFPGERVHSVPQNVKKSMTLQNDKIWPNLSKFKMCVLTNLIISLGKY